MARVALITGGNGITGSAIVEHLVRTTNQTEWSHIIVTSRSPLKMMVQDPRVHFVALDFTQEPSHLAVAMRASCAQVTHAYFSSYVHRDNFVELNAANKALFENFLTALLEVALELETCTLQTGGKYYNLHLRPFPSPAREDDPRSGSPEENFYYPQEDFLSERQQGRPWTWNVIRPQAIIGHTLKPNGMNSALTYAIYFLICRELGEEARMPTNQLYWNQTDECSDARLLAQLTIWASTTPLCANQAFNAVNGDHFSWKYMWPRLASFIGAKATSEQQFVKVAPTEGEVQQEFSLSEWSKNKRPVWDKLCEEAGIPAAKDTFDAATWGYQDWVFQRSWSSLLAMSKARELGWTGYKDSYECIVEAFEKFKELGQIP